MRVLDGSRFRGVRIFAIGLAIAAGLGVSSSLWAKRESKPPAGPRLAHMVFFTLKDHSKEARDKFVAGCEKYLTGHEGATSFSVGVRAEDEDEGAVTVKDFDVALHVVFEDKAAKGKYLVNPRHKAFVDEFKPIFAKVRVFDSYLEPSRK